MSYDCIFEFLRIKYKYYQGMDFKKLTGQPDGEENIKKKKNAESARKTRKRKKIYLELLEKKVPPLMTPPESS